MAEGIERRLKVLREATHALSGTLEEPRVIEVLLDEVISGLGARGALVRLLAPDATELLLAGGRNLSESYLDPAPVRVAESAVDQRVLTGETVVVPDITCEPGFYYGGSPVCEPGAGMVSVPLTVRERVIGVLRAYLLDVAALGPEDLMMLNTMADLGATVLEKVRLHKGLVQISAALNASRELDKMLLPVLEVAVRQVGARSASLRLLDSKRQQLRLTAAYRLSEAYLVKGEVQIGKSPLDQRVLKGEVVALYDVLQEEGLQYPEEAAREGIRSLLAVPLRLTDKVIGSLRVYSAQPRRFGPVAIDFLTSVADLAALAIENADLYNALQARYEDLKLDVAEWRKFLALG